MEKETLSEKIEYGFNDNEVIQVQDVRESVKRLYLNFCIPNVIGHKINKQIIDEIFGDKLT